MKTRFALKPIVAAAAAVVVFMSAFAPAGVLAAPSASTTVTSRDYSVVVIDNAATKRIVLMNDMTCAQFAADLVLPAAGASLRLLDASGGAIASDSAASAMNVATLAVTAEDGVTQGSYSVGPAPASFGKNATASYYQHDSSGTYPPANAFDCDANTRWSSYRGTAGPFFPEWIEVDLGASYDLSKLNMLWYSSGNRVYSYTVWTKDGADPNWTSAVSTRDFAADGFTRAIDRTGNTLSGAVNDVFPAGTKARYVAVYCDKIIVGTSTNAPSIFDFDVYGTLTGCYLTSPVYAVDNTANTITTITYGGDITKADFLKNLAVQGAYQSISINSGDTVKSGDTVTLTDSSGSPRAYAVTINRAPKSEYVYDGGARDRIIINDGWKFYKGSITNDAASAAAYSDVSWGVVNLPHTWNASDMTSGSIWTGDGWYRRALTLDPSLQGKKLYLEFLAAGTVATVWVNGVSAGAPHKGSYEVFRYDITNLVSFAGANQIAVKCNNQNVADNVAPLSADFNFYGGLTRSVSVVATDPVHIDMGDNASQGVYITTPQVSNASATMNVKSKIVNDTAASKAIRVVATLRHPSSFDASDGVTPRFTVDSEYTDGKAVNTMSQDFTVAPGGSAQFDGTMTVDNPRLWNGLKDPYRYQAVLDVYDNGTLVDEKSQMIGFRYYSIDTKTGFFLNGVSTPLRGVDRHYDRPGIGCAVTTAEHDQDFRLMYDMGCNATRLAHFPQADYFYDLCDKYGMVVWAEIPFVNSVAGNASYTAPDANCSAFMDSVRGQLNDMVKQNYNHPAIIFWGMENEVSSSFNTFMLSFIGELTNTTHALDPYRIVTLATNNSQGLAWPTDVTAWNRYDGWYSGQISDFPNSMGTFAKPTGLSEYGAGANVMQHSDTPLADFQTGKLTTGGQFHPVEYQNIYHEHYLDALTKRPDIWGSFVWNMFDFAVASRNEGAQPGMNDKGLMTWDRQTKKDAFYLYKSVWTADRVIHITSPTYVNRVQALIPVKVYSNCDSVSVYVNGSLKATLNGANQQQGVYVFSNIPLDMGANTIEARGTKGGAPVSDSVIWNRGLSSLTNLTSNDPAVTVDNSAKKINMFKTLTWAEFLNVINNTYNASLTLLTAGGTPLDGGELSPGMKVHVVAEDGVAAADYTLSYAPISLLKAVKASYVQNDGSGYFPAGYAVDGNPTTRWSAYRGSTSFPEWIEVDLGAVYDLSQLDMSWYNTSTRAYKYTVWARTADNPNWSAAPAQTRNLAGEGYTQIYDNSNNTTTADTHNVFASGTKGRYLVVYINGGTGGAPTGSIFELDLYGFDITSGMYAVDSLSNTITVKYKGVPPTAQGFLNNISVNGNYSEFSLTGAGGGPVSGDRLAVTDLNGNIVNYTINLVQELPVTVSFDSNGGSAVEPQSVYAGDMAVKPADPTRAGYTFEGWYSGGAAFDFSSPIAGNTTLTARWTPIIYSVAFDSQGGSAVMTQSVVYGGLITKPDDPVRDGYVFMGWFTAPDSGVQWDFDAAVTGGMTLYAQWSASGGEPQKITITMSSSTLKKGASMRLNAVISPDSADKTVTWSSSNANVATVDANGVVTGLKTGTVRISAATSNGLVYMTLLMITA